MKEINEIISTFPEEKQGKAEKKFLLRFFLNKMNISGKMIHSLRNNTGILVVPVNKKL